MNFLRIAMVSFAAMIGLGGAGPATSRRISGRRSRHLGAGFRIASAFTRRATRTRWKREPRCTPAAAALESASPSTRAGSITLRLRPARRATSANNSARVARAARWRSCTSRCSTRSTPSLRRIRSYTGISAANGASIDAAIAQAAHDTLAALFPSQRAALDALLADDLAQITVPDAAALANGVDLGRRAAAAILAMRARRRIAIHRAARGHRLHPERRGREVAPGPDRPVTACARRRMGRCRTVRAALVLSIPRAAAPADVRASATRPRSTK